MGPPKAAPSTESPSQRRVQCRPVMTNSNLPVPGSPKSAIEESPKPALPLSDSTCLSTVPAYSGECRPRKMSFTIWFWSASRKAEMCWSVMCQLLSTSVRSGWSKAKQSALRCSSRSDLKSVATSVSDWGGVLSARPMIGTLPKAVAVARVAVVLRKSRRDRPRQSGQERSRFMAGGVVRGSVGMTRREELTPSRAQIPEKSLRYAGAAAASRRKAATSSLVVSQEHMRRAAPPGSTSV